MFRITQKSIAAAVVAAVAGSLVAVAGSLVVSASASVPAKADQRQVQPMAGNLGNASLQVQDGTSTESAFTPDNAEAASPDETTESASAPDTTEAMNQNETTDAATSPDTAETTSPDETSTESTSAPDQAEPASQD